MTKGERRGSLINVRISDFAAPSLSTNHWLFEPNLVAKNASLTPALHKLVHLRLRPYSTFHCALEVSEFFRTFEAVRWRFAD